MTASENKTLKPTSFAYQRMTLPRLYEHWPNLIRVPKRWGPIQQNHLSYWKWQRGEQDSFWQVLPMADPCSLCGPTRAAIVLVGGKRRVETPPCIIYKKRKQHGEGGAFHCPTKELTFWDGQATTSLRSSCKMVKPLCVLCVKEMNHLWACQNFHRATTLTLRHSN